MESKFEIFKNMILKYGKQTNIFNTDIYKLIEYAQSYLTLEYYEFEHILETIDKNQITDVYRIIQYFKNEITIATLEYKLFNVKPKSYSTEDNQTLTDLTVFDLLNDRIKTCKSCGVIIFSKNGVLLKRCTGIFDASKYVNMNSVVIRNAMGKLVTANNYYFRYTKL